ncbi:MlaD family protein [Flavobacteriaceae bacterium S0825]|uniref:MlaD family protein n=1 Tax=Gaetbulibacter sp. S0825 TaxID=2720084 RepID=UPI00142F6023|nr:MlaD family protein [Gaetbulibacter sp. S0825]MCK0109820.1 MlaD family protein [Flavobacteriaceae bacterium S0825]NIX65449.1 MCE family protein [Gaetbulibacter sp. S0825]
MKITREVKTAVLVISGLLLIVYLFNYLKGENLLDSSRTFYAVYDNVEGLAPSAPVTISGNVVGKVQEIVFTEDGSGKLQLKLMIDNDFQFSKNSKAQIYETGLIGGKAVAIVLANDGSETAVDGDFLEGSIKAGLTELVNQKLTPLQGKIENVMVSADSLLGNINDVFDKQTKTNLKSSISSLNETILSFKNTSNSINNLIANNKEKLDSTITSFESTSANLASLTDEMAKANLGQTITELQTTIDSFKNILSSIEKGEGSMGKLMKEDGLYNNIEGATKELEELLRDIKLHPKRYFRILSKKEIPYSEN